FLWAKSIRGRSDGNHPAIDSAGNIYLAGWLYSAGVDADPGPNSAVLIKDPSSTLTGGYVVKWNSSGSFLNDWFYDVNGVFGVAVGYDGAVSATGGRSAAPSKFDSGTQFVTLSAAAAFVTRTTQDRGNIFGQAFNDLDRNGVNTSVDTIFSGVTIYIDSNNNG